MPGVMQTERVCLHSQTLSIIMAFGLLLRLLQLLQLQNLSLVRFAMLALSLTCLDCLTSKLFTMLCGISSLLGMENHFVMDLVEQLKES